jgi:hypothetical protein
MPIFSLCEVAGEKTMDKPRTVKKTVVVEKTLGQIFHEATARPSWSDLSSEEKSRLEEGAAAVVEAVEGEIPEDVRNAIDSIAALWPSLPPSHRVNSLADWLNDVRTAIRVSQHEDELLYEALGAGKGANHVQAVEAAKLMKSALDNYVAESYARERR